MVAPLLACSFSTFGIDLPADDSTTARAESTGDAPTTTAEPTTTSDPDTTAEPSTTSDLDTTDTGDTGDTDDTDDTTGEPPPDCSQQAPFTLDETLAAIAADLQSPAVDVVAVPFTRYLGLVHLHNAGVCDAEIETHRHALSKLLNSLSLEPGIVAPIAIDDARLLYRIDLRAYGWDRAATSSASKQVFPDVWELLAASDPHAVAYAGDVAAAVQTAATTDFPLLRADAVTRHAVTAPLYYDVLGLPLSRSTLETTLDIDTAGGIAQERSGEVIGKVGRAALHESGVALRHRVVERHAFPGVSGSYWIAYDFLALDADTDVFSAPFDWTPDELNVTFNLPNGLQAHVVFAGDGGRRITAKKELLVDPNLPDGIVRAGISCIGCHARGIQPAEDDLRHALDDGEGPDFDAATQEEIRRLYPPRAELSQQISLDVQRFDVALTAMAVPTDLPKEPVLAAWLEYGDAVGLRRAAAELWLAEVEHDELLAVLDTLGDELAPLAEADGQVTRDVFTGRFAAAICTLGLGRTTACPDG